jgi:ribonuclease HI
MTFDGASSRQGLGVGVVINITTPSGIIFTFSSLLEFDCTNNMVEYEVLLSGLQKAKKMGIKLLKVEGDSELMVN